MARAKTEPPRILRAVAFSGCLAAVLLGAGLSFVQVGFSQSVGLTGTKANLDLPYNAIGEGDDEVDAGDLILFYGGVYEASSVVFCLDYSNSMGKRGERELQQREALRAISELASRTRFGIVFYGGRADLFRHQLVRATESNKTAAKQAITATPLSLGTCMGPALIKALKLVEGEAHGTIILGGDGKPTNYPGGSHQGGGPGKQALRKKILTKTAGANGGKAVLHSIYVGDSGASEPIEFMRQLGQTNGGSFRIVPTN